MLQIADCLGSKLVKFEASGRSSVKKESWLNLLEKCVNLASVCLPLDYDEIINCLGQNIREVNLNSAAIDEPAKWTGLTALTELTNVYVL